MFKKIGSKIKTKMDTELPFDILDRVKSLKKRFLEEKKTGFTYRSDK